MLVFYEREERLGVLAHLLVHEIGYRQVQKLHLGSILAENLKPVP